MPEPAAERDWWTSVLETLETFIVPDWSAVIAMLPIFVVLGVVGPGLTLLALLWMHWRFTRQNGRVRIVEPTPVIAERNDAGELLVGPNVPFCNEHGLIYPVTARTCEVDGRELSVRCPVDGTNRGARQQICRACGTRYVLGASSSPALVRRTGSPPPGGAAVA